MPMSTSAPDSHRVSSIECVHARASTHARNTRCTRAQGCILGGTSIVLRSAWPQICAHPCACVHVCSRAYAACSASVHVKHAEGCAFKPFGAKSMTRDMCICTHDAANTCMTMYVIDIHIGVCIDVSVGSTEGTPAQKSYSVPSAQAHDAKHAEVPAPVQWHAWPCLQTCV